MTPKQRKAVRAARAVGMATAWVAAGFALAFYAIHMGQDPKVVLGAFGLTCFMAYRKEMSAMVVAAAKAWKGGPATPPPACEHDHDATPDATPPAVVDDPDAGETDRA